MAGLDPDERAELARLRHEAAVRADTAAAPAAEPKSRTGRVARWTGATALLVIGAVLGGLAVVTVYLRSQVLDTATFVSTVAPLGSDPTVRAAVAQRVTDEIIQASNVSGLTTDLANRLEGLGAPAQLSELVPPLVSGLSSFLDGKINDLMATPEFQTVFENTIRAAHDGLVTVLTGGKGQLLTSSGDTVTIDLGALVGLVKQKLVAEGFDLFGKIPDISYSYTLIQSDQLPTIRRYTKVLDAAGTWLPWVALLLLAAGILLAPSRRRGIVLAFSALAVVAALLLFGITAARSYYVDNLPAAVQSPAVAAVVIDAMLRFLIGSLQTLLVASLVFVVGALLAGPGRFSVAVRRLVNRGLDAAGRPLARTGKWFATTAGALRAGYRPIQLGLVLLAVAGFVLADRPGVAAVLWTTLAVVAALTVLQLFVRAAPDGQR